MNDETFAECRNALAERMRKSSNDLIEQIEFGFLAATCRTPAASEIGTLVALYETVAAQGIETDPLASVAAVLMNLDEVLNQ
jgi:NAD-dependent DNA ligase